MFVRSCGDRWGQVPLAGASWRPENVAGEDDLTGEQHRSRRARKAILKSGGAAGEEEEAKCGRAYLSLCLKRPPDLSSSGAGRRRLSGRRGGRQLLAEVWIFSG